MPPHGHGGGGHHGGGGGHHGGGGWGGGPGWIVNYAEPSYAELVVVCPPVHAPVLGTDGRVYGNECFANQAGVAVQRRLSMLGDVSDIVALPAIGLTILSPGLSSTFYTRDPVTSSSNVNTTAIAVGLAVWGAAAYLLFHKRTPKTNPRRR